MALTAKDATILTLVSEQPGTNHFDRLIELADDPSTRVRAAKIREEGLKANGRPAPLVVPAAQE